MATNEEIAEDIIRIYAAAHTNDGIVFLTYGELAKRLGREGQHRLLGGPLDLVREICRRRNLPDIATVIVDKASLQDGSMKPSPKALDKYGGWSGLRAEQARVLTFDWSSQS